MYIHWLTVTDSDSNMTIQEDYWCYSPLVYLQEEILPSDWNSRTLYTFPMLVLSQTIYTLHPTFGQQYINLEHSHLRIVIPNATLTTHAMHLSAELEFHSSWLLHTLQAMTLIHVVGFSGATLSEVHNLLWNNTEHWAALLYMRLLRNLIINLVVNLIISLAIRFQCDWEI